VTVTLFTLGVYSNPGILTSESGEEVPSNRKSSIAGSVSNDNNGLTEPSYEERGTPGECDTISLGAHKRTQSASDIQVTAAGHSSPAFFVNMDNNADIRKQS